MVCESSNGKCRLRRTIFLLTVIVAIGGFSFQGYAVSQDTILDLQKLSFFYGRDYFLLRSGRVQMIVQADKADLGPSFTYMLFDSRDPSQNARKERAFNFHPQSGLTSSAAEIVLGNFPFTAFGNTTHTRWVVDDGIPTVEAVWWAGGVQITERICALADGGAFRRTVTIKGVNLAGDDTVILRMSLPGATDVIDDDLFVHHGMKESHWALAVTDPDGNKVSLKTNQVEIGPISVAPNKTTQIETLLIGQIGEVDLENMKALAKSRYSFVVPQTRDRWKMSSQVSTEDSVVSDIYDKARIGLPGMIADDGTMNGGIFKYGLQWVRDTSNTALGALHAGHFELAKAAIDHMVNTMITKDGTTMIAGGFDSPEREQFDQMGELLHLLLSYRNWTGDDSVIREHRELLVTMIERPLMKHFCDETGMVHNKRETWERTFDDAYELFYQTYMILGLRAAAELAPVMECEERAEKWLAAADQIHKAMLSHPEMSLVNNNHLIKRRNIDGSIADHLTMNGWVSGSPASTEIHSRLMPDATMALPVAFRLIDPKGDLAKNTLDEMEKIWNARWFGGGYERYHSSSQGDDPGPWPFATTFIMRGQHEAGMFDRSRRALEWLNTSAGGRTGAWREANPLNREQIHLSAIVPWTSGEIAMFVVRHYLGINFEEGQMVIRPALYPNSPAVTADIRFRQNRLKLKVTGSGKISKATVNGEAIKPDSSGAVHLPRDFLGGEVIMTTASR